ncbi:T9SS type B sorting domain-containing protein [Muriicola sp. Z0-33]|uniref:T9SS type B sorting domain-containing protein n=1 Tax=Muriicola sp. Z0-33 TaxID=2816957 RepID=UPI00223744B4|nr:T9SS type B sorting domain-containing protein [Muriicola sp. Z0-33]
MAQIAADCTNAIPICSNTPVNSGTVGYGIDDFNGAAMSGCLEQTVTGFIESNSAWYRFRTGAAGELGFNIGFDTSEDWDFALYRASDCGSLGDPVRCNFFDNQDQEAYMGVGEDPTGSPNTFLYEDWLQVQPGEDYYLLINNFSNSNSGFSIQFSGNIFVTNPFDALDCAIVNNLLGSPIAACDNQNVILDATMPDVVSYTWYMDTGSGFQTIVGETGPTLQALVSALYRVEVITISMNNVISDVQVGFSSAPTTSPVADEIGCSDIGVFDLSLKDAEALGTQDPNEVVVTYHSTMADATAGSNPLQTQYPVNIGSETIFVRTSSVQNPDCFDASEQFNLNIVATAVLSFPDEVFICEASSGILIGETSPDAQFAYSWDTGENNPSIMVTQAGDYTLTATNSQTGQIDCISIRTVTVIVSETPEITEVLVDGLQQNNRVEVITNISGNLEFQLDGGAFQTSNIFNNVAPGAHIVTVNDLGGCGMDTENIVVVGFPKFFTPNGDGANDLWQIIGISTLSNPVVHVFDRYGKLIKQLNQSSLGWDGTFNGTALPSSDYWFKLSYTDASGQTVQAKFINNHFSLRR